MASPVDTQGQRAAHEAAHIVVATSLSKPVSEVVLPSDPNQAAYVERDSSLQDPGSATEEDLRREIAICVAGLIQVHAHTASALAGQPADVVVKTLLAALPTFGDDLIKAGSAAALLEAADGTPPHDAFVDGLSLAQKILVEKSAVTRRLAEELYRQGRLDKSAIKNLLPADFIPAEP